MLTLKRTMIDTTAIESSGRGIRVAQFNVLAHDLCESGGFDADPEILKWDYRRTLFNEILTAYPFDIMCFEEVDELPLKEIKSILVPSMYDHLWTEKFHTNPNDPRDGTAIFWNKTIFKLEKSQILRFYTRDSIPCTQAALMLRLTSNQLFSVCIVATHLKAKPGFEEIRKNQVVQLMNEIKHFNTNNYPELICGDFNDTPDSLACIEMNKKYRSAYQPETLPSMNLWTTCKKRKELVKRTIDYIFYDNRFKCLQVLDIPQNDVILPASFYPSDHSLIGAVLEL